MDDNECFVCLEGVYISKGKLFRPCLCSRIHEKCLDSLRSQNNRYSYRCPTCRYNYRIARMWLSNIIINPVTISLLSFIVISFCVFIIALFIRFFAYLFIGVKLTSRAFSLSSQIVWWAILTIGFLTMLLSLFGENNLDIDLDFRRPYIIDPYFFEIVGYGFSLTGFLLFIKSVYNVVHSLLSSLLIYCGERILEVERVDEV